MMPDVDLSQLNPDQVARGISVRPFGSIQQADPYAGFSDSPPQIASDQAPGNQGDPYAAFSDAPPARAKIDRTVSRSESAARGALDSITFGFGPAIAGLANASGIPSDADSEEKLDINPIRPFVGAARMIGNAFSDHPDPAVRAAYEAGRQSMLDQNKAAQEQNPGSYTGGQVGGALLSLPLTGAAGAAETGGARILQGIRAGGVGGGLYGAGESTSEGNDIGTIAKDTGLGAVTGAGFGAAGTGVIEGGKKIGSAALSIARGHVNPEKEAARRVTESLVSDFSRTGPRFSPQTAQAARDTGASVRLVDVGGERTQALARSAANTSPEAREALVEATQSRFEQQSPRLAQFIRKLTGGANASDDLYRLKNAARNANRPLYQRAYAAGNRVLASPELNRIAQSPAVQAAIKEAERRGADRAIQEGLSGFNPKNRNLQFWDYVQRELRDSAGTAERSGANDQARVLNGLSRQLLDELDRQVPAFKKARGTAAAFFGGQDAITNGQKFVMGNQSISEARRELAKMSVAERALFARGFASELADRIERTGDNRNVLNSIFLNNGPARQKIELAIGPVNAKKLESALRVETLLNEARGAVQGNSTTARQLAELSHAGGADTAATLGIIQEAGGIVGAGTAIARALIGSAKNKIDGNVARRVGEMLASEDPAVFQRAINLISARPQVFDALRAATRNAVQNGTNASSVVGAHDVGPEKSASGVGAVISSILDREGKSSRREDEHDSSQ